MLGVANRFGIEATICAWRECAPWLATRRHRSRLTEEPASGCAPLFAAEKFCHPSACTPRTRRIWRGSIARAQELPGGPQAFFLERARVALNDGAEFGPPGQGHVRLNFATTPAILDVLLSRMADAVRAL